MKKIISLMIVLILITMIAVPSFAEETTKIRNVTVTVAGDEVKVSGNTEGVTDNMSILIKVISEDETMQYFDVVNVTGNSFKFSFVPLDAKKESKLILKIGGDLMYTKEFVYSESGNDTIPDYKDYRLKRISELLNTDFKVYTDFNGNLDFIYELSDTENALIIKMAGQNFKAQENLWTAKDPDRFKSFLQIIFDKSSAIYDKPIKIYVYDKNKTKVYQYERSTEGSDYLLTPDELGREININYKNFFNSKTFVFSYQVQQDKSVFKITAKGINFTYLDNDWIHKNEDSFTEFIDNLAKFAQKHTQKDIKVYIYDKNSKFVNSYDYYYDYDPISEGKKEYDYKPIETTQISQGTALLKLISYVDNSKLLDDSLLTKRYDNGIMTVALNNHNELRSILRSLDKFKKKQIIFEITGDFNGKVYSVPFEAIEILSQEKAIMTFTSEDFEASIDFEYINPDKINDMFGSLSLGFDIVVECKDVSNKQGDNDFWISDPISSKTNSIKIVARYKDMEIDLFNELQGNRQIPVLLRYRFEDLRAIEDMRTMNIFKLNSSSPMLNSILQMNKNGILFAYEGQGDYYIKDNNKNFIDLYNHWGRKAVNLVASKNIIYGVGENKFNPNATISRAEFISIIARKVGLTQDTNSYFEDVTAGSWYFNTVNNAFENYLLPPTFKTKLQPNKPITREEMAYICVKAYEFNKDNDAITPSALFYDDSNQISQWAQAGVSMATELKIAQGYNNKFSPKSNATRVEGAQMIFNLMKAEKIFAE